jgi:plasmid stability protein
LSSALLFDIVPSSLISLRIPSDGAVTVRKLSPETHRALKVRARGHGRSTEAEIRAILEAAAKPAEGIGVGSTLKALGRRFRGVELEVERDQTPAQPMRFK